MELPAVADPQAKHPRQDRLCVTADLALAGPPLAAALWGDITAVLTSATVPPRLIERVGLDAVRSVEDGEPHPGVVELRTPFGPQAERPPDVAEDHQVELAGQGAREAVVALRRITQTLQCPEGRFPGVTLLETPGHTPGTMSMQVDLPDTGTMIFTSDAVYMGESYGPPTTPAAIVNDMGQFYSSVEKIRGIAERTDATVVFGHDAEQIKQLKLASQGAYYT